MKAHVISAVFALFICHQDAHGAFENKVLLKDVEVLTLRSGWMTSGRRSAVVPQLRCAGGTAGCYAFRPKVVQCYNRGSDGYDAQWECKTEMGNSYRFGSVEVTCEGYNYANDPYILRGSCGLVYTLDLTEEGYKKAFSYFFGAQQHQGTYMHKQSYGPTTEASFGVGDFIMTVIAILIILAILFGNGGEEPPWTRMASGFGGTQRR